MTTNNYLLWLVIKPRIGQKDKLISVHLLETESHVSYSNQAKAYIRIVSLNDLSFRLSSINVAQLQAISYDYKARYCKGLSFNAFINNYSE